MTRCYGHTPCFPVSCFCQLIER